MWIMTVDGFFSIVQKPGQRGTDMLTVRGRVRKDLENLRDHMLLQSGTVGRIEAHKGTDYPYRLVADRRLVALAIADAITGINYDNFKNTVSNPARHRIYGRVWADLTGLEALNGNNSR